MSSASSIPRPHGTTVAAFKGIAITTSLLAAGQLATISTILPTLYPAAQTSHRLAAQQFASLYQLVRATAPPTNILTAAICSALAYIGYNGKSGSSAWKLWTGSAVAIACQIPWTLLLMETPSLKLLWVSEVAETASTTAQRRSSGIGVRVISASPERGPERGSRGAHLAGGMLGVPPSGSGSGAARGAITPMEEFEPFEDGEMDEREYVQLKVIDLLKTYNGYNVVRTILPLTSGVLGLWAALTE